MYWLAIDYSHNGLFFKVAPIKASKASEIINDSHKCYHGSISGPKAKSRLKAEGNDCFLVRYSNNQQKYLLSILKKGLGQDTDSDLFVEFQILMVKNGKRCKIDGQSKTFSSLDEMITYWNMISLHPSVANLGTCCVSERHKYDINRKLTMSQISQMTTPEAARVVMDITKKNEENKKKIEWMQGKLEETESSKRSCSLQWLLYYNLL